MRVHWFPHRKRENGLKWPRTSQSHRTVGLKPGPADKLENQYPRASGIPWMIWGGETPQTLEPALIG